MAKVQQYYNTFESNIAQGGMESKNKKNWKICFIGYIYSMIPTCITLFSHVDWLHDPRIIILCGPLEQIGIVCLLFIHSCWTWKFRWSYTSRAKRMNYCSFRDFFAGYIVHPSIVPWFTINNNTIIESTDIIYYSYGHQFLPSSFCKFLPVKVKSWRPMSYTN